MPEREALARIAEVERRLNRFDDRDLPSAVSTLSERMTSHTATMTDWQQRQDDLLHEMHATLKVVVEQTAERRGSTRTRKAIIAGGLAFAGLMLTVIGLSLQALGVFGG